MLSDDKKDKDKKNEEKDKKETITLFPNPVIVRVGTSQEKQK